MSTHSVPFFVAAAGPEKRSNVSCFLHKQVSHFVCPVNDLKRFNYKMTDLGQVSLYSCFPSLGPGTVTGESGKKRGVKAKQKASEAIRAVECALSLPRPPFAFFPPLRGLILGYSLPSKKINFSRTIASLFEPCSCVFWNEIKSIRVL